MPKHINPHDLAKQLALSKRKGVVGYSGTIQKKIRNGKETPGWAIRIYVDKKLPCEELKPWNIIPPEIDGVPTDIVEVGKMKALGPFPPQKYSPPPKSLEQGDLDPRNHYRPLQAGVSAIALGGTACTLGWFARDLTDNQIVILCNNHCGAGENKHPVGHPYLQTSPYDSAYGEVEPIGSLKRFVEIKFLNFACPYRDAVHALLSRLPKWVAKVENPINTVDLALVTVTGCDVKRELLNIGNVMGKRRGNVGELMRKMGRTTGRTEGGQLMDNAYFGTVQYSRGTAAFGPCGLIQGDKFSAGGDSSSAILCSDNSFAGLLFAGSDTHTIYCHFDEVEAQGNVEIVW